MKKQNEEIDKLFSKGLSNLEEAPSANAWKQIESQLPSRRNRAMYWVAASMAGILLTASIGWNRILTKSNLPIYDSQELVTSANFPQKEFIPVPILIQTKTIVYVDRPINENNQRKVEKETVIADNTNLIQSIETQPTFELQSVGTAYAMQSDVQLPALDLNNPIASTQEDESAVTIIYKKGDPKYPKLAKALNYMKEVGEGERQLINFEKISNNLIARRETNNNSNN